MTSSLNIYISARIKVNFVKILKMLKVVNINMDDIALSWEDFKCLYMEHLLAKPLFKFTASG
jgi:hypothetical protein